jgi:hypothetical protein
MYTYIAWIFLATFCHFFKFFFLPYSTIYHLYDGGQFLLVEERTQIHYTMYLGRDHRPSTSKLTNFLKQSHWYVQDSNWHGLEVIGLMVWDRCFNHLAMEAQELGTLNLVTMTTPHNLRVFTWSPLHKTIHFLGHHNNTRQSIYLVATVYLPCHHNNTRQSIHLVATAYLPGCHSLSIWLPVYLPGCHSLFTWLSQPIYLVAMVYLVASLITWLPQSWFSVPSDVSMARQNLSAENSSCL